jgi:hypothetical protein
MGSGVTGIAAGVSHSLFLKSDRTVWGCGYNYTGQLAQPGQLIYATPFPIAGMSDVSRIFAGGQNTFALFAGASPSFLGGMPNQVLRVGDTLTWYAPATGTPPFTYEWKHGETILLNGGGVSGANTATLSIDPVRLAHAGTYTCTVTNGYGSANQSALLAVDCIVADFNCDEFVDGEDAAMMADCFTGPTIPGPPAGCTPLQFLVADFDGDGDSDMVDFARFQRCIAGPEAVPDPDCAE